MLSLSDIPDLIDNLSLSKRDKVEMLIDYYNRCERSKLFNFFPQLLDKTKILEEFDKRKESK